MSICEPEDVEARALRMLERGRPRAAMAIATVGLCRDTSAAGLWLLRASIHHAERRWGKALADVENAMMLVPLPISAQLVLADCCWFTKRRELALLAYEHLLEAEGEAPEVYAAIYAGLIRCGRRDLALQCCRVAVHSNPDDHPALFAMAHCMAALRYDATYVASVLQKAVDLAPERDAYRVSLAIQLASCGRSTEAHQQVAAASATFLSELVCVCSLRLLVRVCKDANDAEATALLTARIRDLESNATPRHEG